MTIASIARDVHAFLRDQILSGQDEGLTPATPLLELGILDSFGLFKLVGHLNERFPIHLKLEEIEGVHFKTIEAIAGLVAGRLDTVSSSSSTTQAQPSMARPAPDGVAIFESPSCAQAFVMFTGLGGVGMPGRRFSGAARDLVENTPEFFRRAGLGTRNLLLFHDARARSYKDGVSLDLPSREAIQGWIRAWIAARPHIDEIFCIGVSAGGPMAMLTGDRLGAKTVWSFAPRPSRGHLSREMHERLGAFLARVTGKNGFDLDAELPAEDVERIDAHLTKEMVDEYYATLRDPSIVIDMEHLAEVVSGLTPGNGATQHRLYYVPLDECDSLVADALVRCPNVTPVLVAPSDAPEPRWAFSRWVPPERWVCRDHLVVDLLRERGIFETLFPPYRPACVAATTM